MHLGEKTKLNLKCLLTSFSFNFDHKLTVKKRCVYVYLDIAKMGIKGFEVHGCESQLFWNQFDLGCGEAVDANENKRRDVLSQNLFSRHNNNKKAADEVITVEIASLGVNNLSHNES